MTNLAHIAPKLSMLVRLLGTDNDHEAVAAVAAISRLLAAHKASFHDLASLIEGQPDRENEEPRPPPRPHNANDVIIPKRYRSPPRPSGPPIWERLGRNARLLWLERIVTADSMTQDDRAIAAARRAQYYSQPHKLMRPAEMAEINRVFVAAWIRDLRPIMDIQPGDGRLPIRWTGRNRGDVVAVLHQGFSVFDGRDQQFAGSVIGRLRHNPNGLSQISVDEMEKVEDLLLQAYEAGARP